MGCITKVECPMHCHCGKRLTITVIMGPQVHSDNVWSVLQAEAQKRRWKLVRNGRYDKCPTHNT